MRAKVRAGSGAHFGAHNVDGSELQESDGSEPPSVSTTLPPMKEWLKFGGKVILVLAAYRVAKATAMTSLPADSQIRTFLNQWLP